MNFAEDIAISPVQNENYEVESHSDSSTESDTSSIVKLGDHRDGGNIPENEFTARISQGTSEIKGNSEEMEAKGKRDDSAPVKTRKKKKRLLSICTTNCKYDVVRRVAAVYGMREVTEDSAWNLYWTDLSISIERAKDMKRFQKVNHFPGMTEICRKDLLARNLNRMLRMFPKDYNFFPKTWCLPADYGDVVAYARTRRSKTFIIKPDTGCQGRGIYLTKSLKEVKPYERMICQVYLAKPFLLDGYKFDLRVYTLITSCDPLRIYVYNDGLARFATSRYKEPTSYNTSNVFMHLTNYAVNKHSRLYVIDEEVGSKRKISTLNKTLQSEGVDVDELWRKIDEVVVKTILAAYPILKHSYHTCFSTHDLTYACFEILGFDILIDSKLKPYLLEVNHSPSFHTDAQLDKDIKESLLMDTFNMLNLHHYDKRKIIEEDRKRVRDRLLQGINGKDLSVNDTVGPSKVEEKSLQEHHKWEEEHMGNYRRIYPCKDDEKYNAFFKQSSTSMFQDTAASRAREEASKLQREEAIMRMREEESKRTAAKWDSKIETESPRGSRINSMSARNKLSSMISKKLTLAPAVKKSREHVPMADSISSFLPEIIIESEERERVASLTQRDFLIKSHGILQEIYLAMKKNGTLRPGDIKKYGMYGKLGQGSEFYPNGEASQRRQIDDQLESTHGERDQPPLGKN
ncbi:tubulin polyglutamylase TTLL13-like isoform X2 [Fopius arisanus]|nr:PREDICTED: tubulin polyglutamylase TTLL13-like isoform X2 [Fopius arisanus]